MVAAAISDADAALKVEPSNRHAQAFRGFLAIFEQKHDRAIEMLTKAMDGVRPLAQWSYQRCYAYCQRALVLGNAEDVAPGIADCSASLKDAPEYFRTYRVRGLLYRLADNPYLAIADFNEGLKREPSSLMLYAARAGAFEQIRDFEKALADAEKAANLQVRHEDEAELKARAIRQVEDLRKRLDR